jgi:hypothetical protein
MPAAGPALNRTALRSSDPLGNSASSWAEGQFLGGGNYPAAGSAACLRSGFCAIGATIGGGQKGTYGEVITSTGYGRPWSELKLAPVNSGIAVACSSAQFCVAAGSIQNQSTGTLSGLLTVGT